MSKITELCDRIQLLFQECGIKSITMDDISKRLGCSKKTLYQHFKNRKELVYKVVSADMSKHEMEISNVVKDNLHPIDEIFKLNKVAINKIKTIHPSTQHDLKKYYPNSWKIFDKKNKQLSYEVSLNNLKKGMDNGSYRKDINPELLARIFSERIDMIFNGVVFKTGEATFTEVFQQMMNHYILGIVTDQGRSYYLNLQKNLIK